MQSGNLQTEKPIQVPPSPVHLKECVWFAQNLIYKYISAEYRLPTAQENLLHSLFSTHHWGEQLLLTLLRRGETPTLTAAAADETRVEHTASYEYCGGRLDSKAI